MIRPFFLMTSIRSMRDYAKRYSLVIKDSTPMVLFIVVYILYFSWMGQRLFAGTLEGTQYFGTLGDSFFNMLVLMTTSNFPDIMLPAYQRNRLSCLYFIIYLIVGLFLMMNLLLAIFYSNFKSRFEENIDKSEEKRCDYLYEQFKKYGGTKGFLTEIETYKLFMVIHGLVTGTD
jgi:predicted permease